MRPDFITCVLIILLPVSPSPHLKPALPAFPFLKHRRCVLLPDSRLRKTTLYVKMKTALIVYFFVE